jgi:hypothetical protein
MYINTYLKQYEVPNVIIVSIIQLCIAIETWVKVTSKFKKSSSSIH